MMHDYARKRKAVVGLTWNSRGKQHATAGEEARSAGGCFSSFTLFFFRFS
jgi:hypothetical protein